MKKLCCLALVCMMFVLSSCSLGTLFNKSEAVNKNIDVDSNVINPLPSPSVQGLDNYTYSYDDTGNDDNLAFNDGIQRSEMINDELVPAVVIGGIPDDTWTDEGSTPVILYLRDSEGFVIPVTQKAVSQPKIAELTLKRLIDVAINREEFVQYGLYPTIPYGTEVTSFNVVNGVATIDFSSSFLNYKSETDERNMISSIVYTMTQFPDITGVRFTCSGKKLSVMRFGTDATGVLYRANTNINTNKLNVSKGLVKQDIYVFRNSTDSYAYCLPISFEYEGTSGGADFFKTIELMNDVNKSGLATLLPSGTKLIGSNVSNGTITLNLSKDIKRYAGNMREEAILRQLQYTFSQYKGINYVRIYIEGSQNAILPEGTDLSENFKISKAQNVIIE